MKKQELLNKIENLKNVSAWAKGVAIYAYELIESCDDDDINLTTDLLNGVANPEAYSQGGCSLIYNGDIAARLCSKSEIKKTKNGAVNPNKNEDWLKVQSRAIHQAIILIQNLIK